MTEDQIKELLERMMQLDPDTVEVVQTQIAMRRSYPRMMRCFRAHMIELGMQIDE